MIEVKAFENRALKLTLKIGKEFYGVLARNVILNCFNISTPQR